MVTLRRMTSWQFFPNSTIRATALETGVVLSGTLAKAGDVNGAIQVAGEFFPKVHNNLKLPDSQMIAIEVQIYEVARTKVLHLSSGKRLQVLAPHVENRKRISINW